MRMIRRKQLRRDKMSCDETKKQTGKDQKRPKDEMKTQKKQDQARKGKKRKQS